MEITNRFDEFDEFFIKIEDPPHCKRRSWNDTADVAVLFAYFLFFLFLVFFYSFLLVVHTSSSYCHQPVPHNARPHSTDYVNTWTHMLPPFILFLFVLFILVFISFRFIFFFFFCFSRLSHNKRRDVHLWSGCVASRFKLPTLFPFFLNFKIKINYYVIQFNYF